MARQHSHGDLVGKVIAVLVLLGGIGALGVVFYLAVRMFQSPVPGLGLPIPPGGTPPSAASIGIALATLLSKLLILTIMVLAGSLIANKGVHLYIGSATAHHPPPSETHDEPKAQTTVIAEKAPAKPVDAKGTEPSKS
jgi:hypothetical protein